MIGIFVCLIAVGFIYHFGMDEPISVILVIHSPVILFYFSHMVAYGRTYVLTAEGCSVRFLWYEKTYLWEDLTTKRIVKFSKYSGFPINRAYPYNLYAIFAPYNVRKPHWLHPVYYNCIHPWSFIYINLDNPDTKNRRGRQCNGHTRRGRHYEVNEDVFREKMRLWHIVLEEL